MFHIIFDTLMLGEFPIGAGTVAGKVEQLA
jgi:hypothetical protein